jgi:hypothetical protein
LSRLAQPIRRVAALGVCLTALAGTSAALADSTNPDYPGSVLHVQITGPLQAHKPLTIVASGDNQQHEMYPQAYSLWVYGVDPTKFTQACPASWSDMEDAFDDAPPGAMVKLTALAPTEGTSGTFSHDLAYTPTGYGPLRICAYTAYVEDTAANAVTEVKIAPAGSAQTTSRAPTDRTKPKITRAQNTLTCHPGTWSGTQLRFRYRWFLSNRRAAPIHSGAKLTLTRADMGRSLVCTVTASSTAAKTSVTSPAFTVS